MPNEIATYNSTGNVVVYSSADNAVHLDVQLADETVWLTQQQIATLFQKAKSTISYHISNIFKEGELDEKVVVRKIRITTPHGAISGKTQLDELNLYNLDVIISVGYRVKSKRGTLANAFSPLRKWIPRRSKRSKPDYNKSNDYKLTFCLTKNNIMPKVLLYTTAKIVWTFLFYGTDALIKINK